MAPSCLLVRVGVVVGTEAYSNYVLRTKNLLHGPCDGSLNLSLEEVVGDENCTNSEL